MFDGFTPERLRLRPLSANDLDDVVALDSDPEVTWGTGCAMASRGDFRRASHRRTRVVFPTTLARRASPGAPERSTQTGLMREDDRKGLR